MFTLAQTSEDQQRGRQALDMLRQTVSASGDYKVIFALRTEYYGRVIDRLRRGLHDTGSIREYLLTDFDEQSLIEAIQRPTSAEQIPYAADVPFKKYGFCYCQGVAEEIAKRVQIWKHTDVVNGATFTRDESRVLSLSNRGAVKLWDTALRDVDLTPTERIMELEVRSATWLDSAGQLVVLNWDEWIDLVRSPEYAAILKKKESAGRSAPRISDDSD